jgi:hypothetical protein
MLALAVEGASIANPGETTGKTCESGLCIRQPCGKKAMNLTTLKCFSSRVRSKRLRVLFQLTAPESPDLRL